MGTRQRRRQAGFCIPVLPCLNSQPSLLSQSFVPPPLFPHHSFTNRQLFSTRAHTWFDVVLPCLVGRQRRSRRNLTTGRKNSWYCLLVPEPMLALIAVVVRCSFVLFCEPYRMASVAGRRLIACTCTSHGCCHHCLLRCHEFRVAIGCQCWRYQVRFPSPPPSSPPSGVACDIPAECPRLVSAVMYLPLPSGAHHRDSLPPSLLPSFPGHRLKLMCVPPRPGTLTRSRVLVSSLPGAPVRNSPMPESIYPVI